MKNPPAMGETWVRSLGWEDLLEKGKATHSSILAWRLQEDSHGLYSPWNSPGLNEYWSGEPFPSPGDLPNPGIEPRSPPLQTGSLPAEPPGKPIIFRVMIRILEPEPKNPSAFPKSSVLKFGGGGHMHPRECNLSSGPSL